MAVESLMDAARLFLKTGREEIEDGLASNNHVKVRDGAEKAWNAAVQAVDHAMQRRGTVPMPGKDAHRDRRDFLVRIGRRDLAQKYSYFSERLHGDVFYGGIDVKAEQLRLDLEEVDDFLRQIESL